MLHALPSQETRQSSSIPHMFPFIYFHEERFERAERWEEILQTSKLVNELPASLLYSGYEELEEIMFFSL